ncbi:MAG: T9SS type A sorting domain-containing protein [Legionella sp.]|uniref:T9SS type A sorting domain-containing protein n=1 Tax=Legionella sp. TaxID=459 RepID=UPI0028453B12|nr:T9SS type A sorting domain-containing protein [Legionella sp.]
MKRILLYSVLFTCLPAFICPQSQKERRQDPFFNIHQQDTHEQIFGKQPGGKEFQGIQKSKLLNKNYKNKGLSSVFYVPTKVTCLDTLRYTYTYDNSGHELTELDETWSNNAWINYCRSTHTYDDSGRLLTNLSEYWSNNAWIINYRETYTYNNSGNRLTRLYENWANNAWVILWRVTFTYDNSGNMLTELEEDWSNNAWVNGSRNTYTYDNSGRMLTILFEYWSNNTWVILWRDTFTYDNSGNKLTNLLEDWSNNAWVIVNRATFTYDYNDNIITELDERWTINIWVNSNRATYTYDDNGNCIHGEYSSWQNDTWISYSGPLELEYNHHQNSMGFRFAVVDIEYASITGVTSEQLNLQSFNLQQNYPNPFNPTTTINYSLAKEGHVKLTVYNSIGCKVATIVDENKPAGNYSVQFNGSKLASGIYLYRLESGDYNSTKKLIFLK